MTYAFITEWKSPEEAEKFDRDLRDDPVVAVRRQAQESARQLMSVFGLATE